MDKSRRQARIERRKADQRKSQLRGLVYIVIAAVLVTAVLIFANQVRAPEGRTYTMKNGDSLGNPDAPVVLVEYADFQCIHCYNFHNSAYDPLIEEYVETGQVLLQVRMVDFLGEESHSSAEAAYCAAEQNLFWEYHDVVFANYSSGNVGGYSQDRLVEFAESLDMDVDAFTSCLESGRMAAVIEANLTAASLAGVTGTPSLVLNGRLLPGGNLPFEQLSAEIEAALAAQP